MTHRYRHQPERSSLGPTVAVALAAGAILVGGSALARRWERQRDRVERFPDSAPARTRRAPSEGMQRVGHSVTIGRPRHELYAFWREFDNLPKFMSNVERVVHGEPGQYIWTIAGPAGTTVDLHTEITEEREGELIAWRTLPGSDVKAEGRVTFKDATGGRGTVIDADISYQPPGGEIGRWMAKLFQREPSIQGRHELKRLKMLMETGEIATSANRNES